MKSMSERMNHEKCDAKFCSWPVYHRDLKELDNTGEYMDVPIVDHHDKEVPNVTRSSAKRAHVNNADNVRVMFQSKYCCSSHAWRKIYAISVRQRNDRGCQADY